MSTEAQESAFTEAQESAYKAGLIRFHQGNKVIGAGLYIDNGYILTCAHVITQGLNLGTKPQGITVDSVANKLVKVDFPFVAEKQFQNAEIVPALWRLNDQDLAVLKILEAIPKGVTPLSFKETTYYREHRYHVYGFPDGHPDGVWAQGEIGGELTRGWVQMEGTRAEGLAIEPGFSGAPVWDEKLEGIAGMTVARDKDREEAKVGFMIPYQRLKSALEAIALFDLLLPEADNLAPYWQSAYQFVRPEISRESHPLTLQEAVLQVQNMSEQGSGYRAITQFIGYLSQPKLRLDIQPKLIQWLESQGINASSFLQEVKQKVEAQQAKHPVGLSPHLLFWVQEELNSDRYSVQAYLVSDRDQYDPLSAMQLNAPANFLEKSEDGKVDQLDIEKILRACLNESSQKLRDIRKLRLEIFLPLHHLNWEVDRWPATDDSEPDLIGCRYQVVVRIIHRWEERYSQYRGDWDSKWRTVTKFSDRQSYRGLICGDGQKFKKIRQNLRHADVTGLILTQYPTIQAEDMSNSFIALLHAGSPIAIWSRQAFDDHSQQFKQLLANSHSQFERLIAFSLDGSNTGEEETDSQNQCDGLLGCCLSQLPESVRAWRDNADQECDDGEIHAGQHIGFIWEDPKLVPPVADIVPRFRMSA